MRPLIATILALSLAWCWDRFLRFLKLNQKWRVGFGIPLGEEIIKYSLAITFQLQPWLVYLLFGLGEGVLETILLKGQFSLKILLAGGLIHLGFGLFFLFSFPQELSWGFAIITHLLWNNLLIRD